MATPSREARRDAAAFLDTLEGDGKLYHDLTGPAAYRLEPTYRTAIRCDGCRFLSLIPDRIPRRPTSWTCPRCGRREFLTPPLEVLAAPEPPAYGELRRRALS